MPTYSNSKVGGEAPGTPWCTTTSGSPDRSARTNGSSPSPKLSCRSCSRSRTILSWPEGIDATSANASLGDVVQSAASGPTSAIRCASCLSQSRRAREDSPAGALGMLVKPSHLLPFPWRRRFFLPTFPLEVQLFPWPFPKLPVPLPRARLVVGWA